MRKQIWFSVLILLLPISFSWAAVVPSVGGRTQAEAQAALEAANLVVGAISEKLLALAPPGIVVAQDPMAGATVPDGSAVALTVALPAPLSGQTAPDPWAGEWNLTIAFYNLLTNSLEAEESFTETICVGDPLGLSLLSPLTGCAVQMLSEEKFDVQCGASFHLGPCQLDVSVQFLSQWTGGSLTGTGQWTTLGSGDCSILTPNQPADQGETIEVAGTRVSMNQDACTPGPTGSLLQKFVSGLHPALIQLEQLVADDDSDGIPDDEDNCPNTANPDQVNTDSDDLGDACDMDDDGDGVSDNTDNCPLSVNADQLDSDGDGLGDACDPDIDGDGVANGDDICEGTLPGMVVDLATGCSLPQLCPCEGPRGALKPWRNHGKYVSCVAMTSNYFVELGLISEAQKDALVADAAESACGP